MKTRIVSMFLWAALGAFAAPAQAQQAVGTPGCETIAQGSQPTAATAGVQRKLLCTTEGVQYVQQGSANHWTAGLDNIGATLTELKAAPGAGLSLYLQTVVAQSTTTTAGQFTLRFGTGTNCGTGTGNLLNNSATARNAAPANTVAATVIEFVPPIKVTANNAVCLLGVATNTTSMTMTGFTAP